MELWSWRLHSPSPSSRVTHPAIFEALNNHVEAGFASYFYLGVPFVSLVYAWTDTPASV
jgi:hypothetical protein